MSKKTKPDTDLIAFKPLGRWDNVLAPKKLDELYDKVIALADSKINWYKQSNKTNGNLSKIIRLIAILLFIGCTLMPYLSVLFGNKTTVTSAKIGTTVAVSTAGDAMIYLYIGYIFAGLGGGILLFDKYYGLSDSWTRGVLTLLDLENMRNEFVESWQDLYFNNVPLTPAGFGVMITALLNFQDNFHNTVKAETQAWATAFQQNLQDLMSAIKTQGDTFKAGIAQQRQDSAAACAASASSNDISTLPPAQQISVIKQAIADNRAAWKSNITNYTGVSIGKKVQGDNQDVTDPGTYCIQFNVTQKGGVSADSIHSVLPFIFSQGYRIGTDVIETGAITSGVFSGENLPLPKPPGCSIGRANVDAAGTLGLLVKLSGDQLYGLSCYHVLFPAELKAQTLEIKINDSSKIINTPEVVSPGPIDVTNEQPVSILGDVSHGQLNNFIDCGFFKTDAGKIANPIYQLPQATTIYDLQTSDEKTLQVKYCGRASGPGMTGVVFTVSNAPTITYFPNTPNEMKLDFTDVILLQTNAQGGDSGSVVLTTDNQLLGMIFAVGTGYAWAISMRGISNNFPFTVV